MHQVTLVSVVISTLVLVSVNCNDPEFEEKVRCVIDTQLSSKQCRDTAHQNAEMAPNQEMGCQTLLTFKNSLKDFNCTRDDFLLLKSLVCDGKDVQCKRNRPVKPERRPRAIAQENEIKSEDISKEKILCIIETKLTPGRCRDTARERAENGHDPRTACSTLMAFKGSLSTVGCTEEDFKTLKSVVCDKEQVQCTLPVTGVPKNQPNEGVKGGVDKEKILCVIETRITPGLCRDTARERSQNDHDPKNACNTLVTFKPTLKAVNCTDEDYEILKSIVCDNQDIPCTMTGAGSGKPRRVPRAITEGNEIQSEDISKEKMLCVIETRLTPGRCRDTARERAENGHDPRTACSTLMAFKGSLSTVGCTEEDFNTLKSVVCDMEQVQCTLPSSGNEIDSEDISKEKMLCVIETKLTPGRCRDTARERAENAHDPKTACSTLMAFKGSLSTVGCTQEDFSTLKSVVCDKEKIQCTMPVTDKKPPYEIVKEGVDKEKILCVIETRITPGLCRDTARERSQNDHDPKNACNTLVTFKPTLKAVNCTDEDYEILKSIVCDNQDIPCTMPGADSSNPAQGKKKIDKENVKCVIQTKLTPGRCRDYAIDQAKNNQDERIACTTLLSSKHLATLYGCTNEDFQLLKDVICDSKDVPCTTQRASNGGGRRALRSILRNPPQGQQPNEDPMKKKILCVIETQLSSEQCKQAARNGAQQGQDPSQACPTLLAAESTIAAVGCSKEDFQKLKAVVCDKRDVPCSMRRHQ